MPFEIVNNDIASMTADAIVYADTKQPFSLFNFNPLLLHKKGKELLKSRQEIGPLATGDAKIAPASMLDAKYIIHTSAPVWHGGLYHETAQLRSCYEKAFRLAIEYQCKSIALPIIATDNLGYPKKLTQQTAFECIRNFLLLHDIMVYLVVPGRIGIQLPGNQFSSVSTYIKKNYVPKNEIKELHTQETPDISSIPSDESAQAFSAALLQWMRRKSMSESDLGHKANISAALISEILNNKTYKPNKKTVISLGMALTLTLDEMKHMIESAGYRMTHNSKFDLIIEYCISQNIYDVFAINQIMFRFEEDLLGVSI